MKTILDADERTSKAPGCMDCGSGSFIRLDCVRAVGEALFEVLIQWSVLAVWYRNTAMAGMVSFDGVVPDSGKYRHFRQCWPYIENRHF